LKYDLWPLPKPYSLYRTAQPRCAAGIQSIAEHAVAVATLAM